MENENTKEIKRLLEEAKTISLDEFKLNSDDEIGTEKDIYGQIQDLINNIEELGGF